MSAPRLPWPFQLWAAAATLAVPAILPLLRRRLKAGKEVGARLGERRGIDQARRPEGRLVWLHAASVGETLSLLPLLQALCRQDPALRLLVTTGTVTAQRLLSTRVAGGTLDGRLIQRFVPLDVPRWIGRFLERWQPDLAVLVESELWPNLIGGCSTRGIPIVLLNARLSERSARRWARVPWLVRPLLQQFAWIDARSQQDADRLRRLGAGQVESSGDLKWAAAVLPVDAAALARLREAIGVRPVWLAASTHEGEEEAVLRLHRTLALRHPALLTIVAPRHPERGAAVSSLLEGAPRRAAGADPDPDHGFWVCDTLGELGLLYRLAGIVLVGNSLDALRGPGGGHNPLEPARLDCAVVVGPLARNFEADVTRLRQAGALELASDEPALATWLDRMLDEPAARDRMARAGLAAVGTASDLPEQLAARLLRRPADRP